MCACSTIPHGPPNCATNSKTTPSGSRTRMACRSNICAAARSARKPASKSDCSSAESTPGWYVSSPPWRRGLTTDYCVWRFPMPNGLTLAQRYHFDAYGYVLLENVLTPAEVARMKAALYRMKADADLEGKRVYTHKR